MALTKCTECKRQISDQAPACPHCGVQNLTAARRVERKDALEFLTIQARSKIVQQLMKYSAVSIGFLVAGAVLRRSTSSPR